MINSQQSWTIRNEKHLVADPFWIIGVINLTPDSFSDGGTYQNFDNITSYIQKMIKYGVKIVDIGAESARPFAIPISEEEEQKRLLSTFVYLKKEYPEIIYSIDTYKASTAKKVLELGADIINDISACEFEPSLLDHIIQYKPGYVLMHTQGNPMNMQLNPTYKDVIEELLYFFEYQLNRLVKAGLPENRIVIDPGIGFGKRSEHIESIFKNIERFFVFNRPLYIGLSRKSCFKHFLGLDVHNRDAATAMATALLAARGIQYHRVHNIEVCTQALHLAKICTPIHNYAN